MINKLLFLILIFLIGCGETKQKKPNQSPNTSIQNAFELNYEHLFSKSFECGNLHDFTDSCKFNFECDCCFGDIFFNPDSTFYQLKYCQLDIYFFDGNYSLFDNMLNLNYSGKQKMRIYNWEYELDSTLIEYELITSINAQHSQILIPELCTSKLILKSMDFENPKIFLDTKSNFLDGINFLIEMKFIQ